MKRKRYLISLLPLVLLVLMIVIWLRLKSNTKQMNTFSARDKSQTIAVLTREALQSYQVIDKKLVGNGSVPIKTADVVNDSLLIDKTLLFSTGHVTSSTKDFYIYTLDLDNGNLHKNKRQAFPTTGEVKDSQHFYTLTSEAGLKTTVQQFSKTGKFLKEANPEYLLGDNYWDDYRNCPKCTKYINVGNGILSKLHLKNITCIKNMYEVFKVL